MAGACWAADSRQILSFMDLQMKATVWSLTECSETAYIENPKLLPPHGLDFSSNNQFMCIIQKKAEMRNWVSIFYAGNDWKIVNGFETPEMWDPVDCKWVMDNSGVVVQDNPIESRFTIYNAMTGQAIVNHTPDSHLGLGIRRLVPSPNGKLTACGLFDTNLVVYSNSFLHQVCELEHTSSITIDGQSEEPSSQPDIFKEEQTRSEHGGVQLSQSNSC